LHLRCYLICFSKLQSMKRITIVFMISFFLLFSFQKVHAQSIPKMNSLIDSISYLIGLETGISYKYMEFYINPDLLKRGIIDGLGGSEALFSNEQIQELKIRFRAEEIKMQQKMMVKQAMENKKNGLAWLEQNKQRRDVLTLHTGLQYRIIKPGTGKRPKAGDKILVHYTGKLIDGTIFDTTYDKGKPAELEINNLIMGLKQGIQLMSEGAIFEFFIAPDLGYGDRQIGNIPASSTLLYTVELISVQSSK
jgi:FKBP-type peptidyl-prolyl cis-trans isomerase FklB